MRENFNFNDKHRENIIAMVSGVAAFYHNSGGTGLKFKSDDPRQKKRHTDTERMNICTILC
jgi:hypothetical protein